MAISIPKNHATPDMTRGPTGLSNSDLALSSFTPGGPPMQDKYIRVGHLVTTGSGTDKGSVVGAA